MNKSYQILSIEAKQNIYGGTQSFFLDQTGLTFPTDNSPWGIIFIYQKTEGAWKQGSKFWADDWNTPMI